MDSLFRSLALWTWPPTYGTDDGIGLVVSLGVEPCERWDDDTSANLTRGMQRCSSRRSSPKRTLAPFANAALSWPVAACNYGPLTTYSCSSSHLSYGDVAQTASKCHLSSQKTTHPQSRRDEDPKVDLKEINLLRRQSILPPKPKPH